MADEGLVRDIVSMIREGQKANTDALKDLTDIIRSHDKQTGERIGDFREEIGKQKGNFELHRQGMLSRLEALEKTVASENEATREAFDKKLTTCNDKLEKFMWVVGIAFALAMMALAYVELHFKGGG